MDDGSNLPLVRPSATPLDVRLVRQERHGFRLARTCNIGVRVAADILLFLDSVLLAEAAWMEAYARWHHAVFDALTIGFVAHAEVGDADAVRRPSGSFQELLAGRPIEPLWVESQMRMTNDLV